VATILVVGALPSGGMGSYSPPRYALPVRSGWPSVGGSRCTRSTSRRSARSRSRSTAVARLFGAHVCTSAPGTHPRTDAAGAAPITFRFPRTYPVSSGGGRGRWQPYDIVIVVVTSAGWRKLKKPGLRPGDEGPFPRV